MKIWQKTLLAPFVALIGLTAIGYALHRIDTAKTAMQATFTNQGKVVSSLSHQRIAFARRHAEAINIVFGAAKAEKDALESDLKRLDDALERFVGFIKEDVSAVELSENENSLLSELATATGSYRTELRGAIDMGVVDAAIGMDGLTKAARFHSQVEDSLQALLASIQVRGREVETAATEVVATWIRIAMIAGATTLVLLILLSAFTARQMVKPLRELAAVAKRIAAGDLDGSISTARRDETGEVLTAFVQVKERLLQFEQAQLAMAAAHEAGDTDHRIDAASLPGAYGNLATKVNELVDAQLALQADFISVMNDYARGELSTTMRQLPGKKAQITDAASGVQRSLGAISSEIDQLVAAAAAGDFSARGDAAAYQAQFAKMVGALNTLMTNCEAGLSDANRVFAALARGDLTTRIEADYSGMFGQMRDNANEGMESLGALIGRIRQAGESVGTAAAEIARGNLDLSARTEAQAASLEQTTASIEELTGTVAQNAESARQANQLATNASQIASRGGSTVHQVVATMGSIAASSKRVQDIISVIDGIAFQTNILALNAAVEAARAGDQGKGFAVVATEVRSLAQRSAAAAKEIKSLITDSAAQVDSGTTLVNAAGAQMGEIVEAVKQVTDIIGSIAAASAEQHQGIEQVNRAVTQMDSATQQNAALVEQASAAAESMKQQAHALNHAVGEFVIANSEETEPYVERERAAA